MIPCEDSFSKDTLRYFGFSESLGQLIRCPEAVRRALYNYSSIQVAVTVDSEWNVPMSLHSFEV